MITYSSTPAAIKKEVAAIDKVLAQKSVKAIKVFKYWLKNHKGEGLFLLGKDKYTINNNTVHCWWVGESCGKNNFFSYGYCIETPNKDGRLRYIVWMPIHSNEDKMQTPYAYAIELFTCHFCQRLQERHGKTFYSGGKKGC